jgi:hypothetical protein
VKKLVSGPFNLLPQPPAETGIQFSFATREALKSTSPAEDKTQHDFGEELKDFSRGRKRMNKLPRSVTLASQSHHTVGSALNSSRNYLRLDVALA